MANNVLFYMWQGMRESLIAEHQFYIDQARSRLLSQFDNISDEADKAANDYWEKRGETFNPDFDDPCSIAEAAFATGGEYYCLLTEMHDSTRLSVVAGMYHQWDKKLREWLVRESRHFGGRSAVAEVFWRKPFNDIIALLDGLGWDVSEKPTFNSLKACDLVVNVYKHGEGRSLNELKQEFPQFLPDPLGEHAFDRADSSWINHTHLRVSDAQLQSFSDAIIEFWRNIPEYTRDSEDLSAPVWLTRALQTDAEANI
ncbi:MAG: hypothetical protein IBX52_08550 [Bacterioplanes sp.]|nr:hypothetical protein [Bacterioplanes sp.]